MRADFSSALENLIAASGGRIWIASGDRDTELQRRLWEDKLAEYGLPPDIDPDDPRAADARNYVAPPGHSNHEKGLAADLAGDLALAHQLAGQFGLYFPMPWEEWHIEIMGSRDEAQDGYTTPPAKYASTGQSSSSLPDYNAILASMMGGPVNIFEYKQDPMFAGITPPTRSLSPERSSAPVFTTSRGGPDGIDDFMRALRTVESSNNYQIEGVMTDWGTATGAYQFLDSTWGYYRGYARAKDAPPEVQDERARQLMQEYYNKFGDWDSVAAAWYSGEGGNWQSSEVREYVAKVNAQL